jgi:hypothetical protein
MIVPTLMKLLPHFLFRPGMMVLLGSIYIAVYYAMAAFFHHYAKRKEMPWSSRARKRRATGGYRGFWARVWRKRGFLDRASSVLWVISAISMLVSLLVLLSVHGLKLRYIVAYYILFIFLFAICYNLAEWHYKGMIDDMEDGLIGEFQCVTMSIQLMTGGYHTSAKPADWRVEIFAGAEAVLGVFFIAVYVAKAVTG